MDCILQSSIIIIILTSCHRYSPTEYCFVFFFFWCAFWVFDSCIKEATWKQHFDVWLTFFLIFWHFILTLWLAVIQSLCCFISFSLPWFMHLTFILHCHYFFHILQIFVEAKRTSPSILYIPHIGQWWETVGPALRATFLSLLSSIPAFAPILLLATCSLRYKQLGVEVWKGRGVRFRLRVAKLQV